MIKGEEREEKNKIEERDKYAKRGIKKMKEKKEAIKNRKENEQTAPKMDYGYF